jgi:hypothetical protein
MNVEILFGNEERVPASGPSHRGPQVLLPLEFERSFGAILYWNWGSRTIEAENCNCQWVAACIAGWRSHCRRRAGTKLEGEGLRDEGQWTTY